jgi:hypothetical protein
MTYPQNVDLETPEADAAEQATTAAAEPFDEESRADDRAPNLDLETPEWDAQEQAQSIDYADDDYR